MMELTKSSEAFLFRISSMYVSEYNFKLKILCFICSFLYNVFSDISRTFRGTCAELCAIFG